LGCCDRVSRKPILAFSLFEKMRRKFALQNCKISISVLNT
jgi:hypothetical protein